MASQVLNNIEVEASQPFMLRDILPGPAWAPYRAQEITTAKNTLCAHEQDAEASIPLKGFLVGIGIEAVMALGLFCAWELWRHIR